jgi:hypothetical protein
VRAGLEGADHVLVIVESGQDEHRHPRVLGRELLRKLDAVHPGHPHVHERHLGG